MSGKKKPKMKKNEPTNKQVEKEENPLLAKAEKKIQAHLDKVREKRASSGKQRDYDGEGFPVCAKISIVTWRRVLKFSVRENLYKSHAINRLLEAGLDALDA